MLQRLLRRDALELVQRKLPERPARSRQPDKLHFVVRAHAQALVHGVVLAVDGQDGHVALARSGGQDLARGHHALLVGQAHWFAGQNGRMRRLQSGHADDGRNHKIGLGQGRAGNRALGAMHDFDPGDAGLPQPRGQLRRPALPWPLKPRAAASAQPAQRLRPRCGRRPAQPLRNARETARRWRGCFARWSRWNREWRVVSKQLLAPSF